MSTALLVLGNQLFPVAKYKNLKIKKAFMAEDYGLCTHYKYHKHKIIFFLSAMRQYKSELDKAGIKVSYYKSDHKLFKKNFEDKLKDFLSKNKKIKKIVTYSIEDQFFEQRINKFCEKHDLEVEYLLTPMFLTSRLDLEERLAGRKRPFMKTFYEWQRQRLEIMVTERGKPIGGQWSFDKDNRKKMPKDVEPPELPKIKLHKDTKDVIKFVDKTFKDHPGSSENFWLPTTRAESLKWFNKFIKTKLSHFGDYQDAITSRSDFVYHSVVSPMINMGLLLPDEVVEKVVSAHLADPETIPINAAEGFVRQVIGWREFVRGIYQNFGAKQWESNFWNHKRKLKSCWYDGTTGIPVLDDAIKKADTYAYNHHIERLMIICNFMLLAEVHPHQVYAWFMEMNADSSDWVMGPNVFGMGQFSDGGIFATKPYVCGSNYYIKMSDYKKGDWCHTADGLYWKFIDKHIDFYKKNPRMSMMTKHIDKMDPDRKKMIFSAANKFIKKTTTLK